MRERVRHETAGSVGGRRKQSGIPTYHGNHNHARRAHGLLVRGVVTATYVQLDENPYPTTTRPGGGSEPLVDNVTAVYCDVLVYSGLANSRTSKLRQVLVSQERSGMHDGAIWKPRAASLDVSAPVLDPRTAQPYDLDGDHVLVGFLDDNLDLPIVLRAIPHPRTGYGNEDRPMVGHRQRLKLVDGQPDLRKHRGTFYGVDDRGDFVVDTTRAHGGAYEADGRERPADDGAHGDVVVRVNSKQALTILGVSPDGEDPKFSLVLKDNELHLKLVDGESLKLVGKDGSTVMTVGDGSKHVAIVEHLKTLYDALKTAYDDHTHPDTAVTTATVGPSAVPGVVTLTNLPPTSKAPGWDAAIASTKVSIPDG